MGNSSSAQTFGGIMKIAGDALGSALGIGGAIAGLAAGPETLPLTLPAAIGGTTSLVKDISSLIKDRNFSEITGDAMGDSASNIVDGVQKFAGMMPEGKMVGDTLENMKNIVNRGSNATPIGEISKIISPIKNMQGMGGQLGAMAKNIQNTASISEGGKLLQQAAASLPPSLDPRILGGGR